MSDEELNNENAIEEFTVELQVQYWDSTSSTS